MNNFSAAIFDIWKGASCGASVPITSGSGPAGPCSLCDGLQVAINIVNGLTTAAIVIATAMIIYGAVRLMLSGGSEQMFKDAKGTITSAVIGLAIVLGAWLIINTVIHIISGNVNFPWASIKC
ncbi:MAG: hypothetical protein AAB572_00790 [Patescibacteria group bacterium]